MHQSKPGSHSTAESLHRIAGNFVAISVCAVLAGCGGGGSAPGPMPGNPPPNPTGNLTGTLQSTRLPAPGSPKALAANLEPYQLFEAGQVRPLALSPDGQTLFALNTPDNRLEIFDLQGATLTARMAINVGMSPVALAVSGNQVWVVNHLSDSVSVVDMALSPPRVVRTLLVGDEPRDIVFAGPNRTRAFITTAHRGQNADVDPQLTTPGVGRADVWVFDRDAMGARMGGAPLRILTLFGDTPRALAASPDGATVYAAVFHSGNRTTVVRDVPTANKAPPFSNVEGFAAPLSGYILEYDGRNWVDETGRSFDARAQLFLPDTDVFAIDAMASVPAQIEQWAGVGTTLFNMAVNPVNGRVYVSNTQSRNSVRFEGPGIAGGSVRGHIAESRISVLGSGGSVTPVHLNGHIDRARAVGTAQERAQALALPLELAVSADGATLYVTAMSSNKLAAIDTGALEAGDIAGATHIELSGGGPTGVVLDDSRGLAFVLTRYDNGISVVDLNTNVEIEHLNMFSPEPIEIVRGRPFLYDATLTSSAGDSSCASCHVFGDTDHLAWDLGNPDAVVKRNPLSPVPSTNPPTGQFIDKQDDFHPMKGPKGTQSLRGLANHGPMHWRGDRVGANRVGDESQEEAALKEFNEAFDLLLGREGPLDDADMQSLTDFLMALRYPPNPIRALDNSLTADQLEGQRVYTNVFTSPGSTVGCNTCHVLDEVNGRFGTSVFFTAVLAANEQDFKVPHFRNLYQRVGFFRQGLNSPQIRGFGYSEPGSTAGLMALVNSGDFQFETARQPAQLVAFLSAFPATMAPIMGQQITLSAQSPDTVDARIDLMATRAQLNTLLPECDLIAKGIWNGEQRGALQQSNDVFITDRQGETLSMDALKSLGRAAGNHLTFTCVPPNSGTRMGIDRNLNNVLDGDEAP